MTNVSSCYLICSIITISQRFNLFHVIKAKTYLNNWNSETNWFAFKPTTLIIGFMTYAKVFANNNETVHSEACINRSCSKAETLLRKTDTCDIVCFLYTFLLYLSKAVEKDIASDEQLFSVLRLKSHLSHADRNESFTDSEKQRFNLNIFVNFLKKKHFFIL